MTLPVKTIDPSLFIFLKECCLTILEDSLHIQSIGGAGLIVRATLQVVGQLPGPGVIDHSGVGGTDCICEGQKSNITYRSQIQTPSMSKDWDSL